MNNPFSMIPPKYLLPLALVGGGLLAWRFISGSSPAPDASASSMGYDPSLVALGVQTSLERDKLNAEVDLAKSSMQTELQALDKEYASQSTLASMNADLSKYAINSNEAIKSAEMGSVERMQNANLAYTSAFQHAQLGVAKDEIMQQYNLANYQTMVEHDLGKKGISVTKESNRIDFLGGIAKLFSRG